MEFSNELLTLAAKAESEEETALEKPTLNNANKFIENYAKITTLNLEKFI